MTSYFMVLVVLSVTILKIYVVELCMTLTVTSRMDQGSNVYLPIKSSHATFHLLPLTMFALSAIVSEIRSRNVLDLGLGL